MKIQGTKIRGLKLYSSAATVDADSYFNLVSLLLPGNGTNGAQNNTFLDSSTNNLSITRNGNPTQGTFSPFSQTGWSVYFGGTNYLTSSYNIAFAPGSGDFTVECWVYFTASPTGTDQGFVGNINMSSGDGDWLLFWRGGVSRWEFSATSNGSVGTIQRSYNTTTPSAGQWYHVVGVKNGSTLSCYVNGVKGTDGTLATVNNGSSTLNIGQGASDTGRVTGNISNLRITKGGALYSGSTFTPPTAPLTTTVSAGTVSLLTCQSNRFIDNSTNAFALVTSGAAVQPFSPFNPDAAYSTTTVGGSAYLDGSGDYLTISNPASLLTFGTGDFTIECFVYPTAGSSSAYVCWIYGNSIDIVAISVNSNTGAVTFTLRGTNLSQTTVVGSTGLVRLNEWTHLALVRTGTNFYGYVNGTRFSTTIAANAAFNEAQAQFFTQPQIGASSNPVGNYFTGYVSGWRALKGTALYTAATITVPSAPLTAVANTSALLNSTNGGITDATAKNVLETVGGAAISTAQSKWGGSSMYFDGTGDYLSMVETAILNFGSGDFTIEAWIYATATVGANRPIWSTGTNNTNWMSLFLHTTAGRPEFFIGSGGSTIVDIWPADVISTNTWYHLAVTRSGSTFRMFLNGTVIGSGTSATAVPDYTDNYRVGYGRWNGDAGVYAGYINDLRITRGYARYTANFTPPTAAFPTQ